MIEAYVFLGTSIIFAILWAITVNTLSCEKDKNKDLQLENSDLIDRNLKLQEEVGQANKDWLKLSDRLADALDKLVKKKELLEIQDRLLEENNIKH